MVDIVIAELLRNVPDGKIRGKQQLRGGTDLELLHIALREHPRILQKPPPERLAGERCKIRQFLHRPPVPGIAVNQADQLLHPAALRMLPFPEIELGKKILEKHVGPDLRVAPGIRCQIGNRRKTANRPELINPRKENTGFRHPVRNRSAEADRILHIRQFGGASVTVQRARCDQNQRTGIQLPFALSVNPEPASAVVQVGEGVELKFPLGAALEPVPSRMKPDRRVDDPQTVFPLKLRHPADQVVDDRTGGGAGIVDDDFAIVHTCFIHSKN